METELSKLYDVLSSYKTAIIENFNKIDENLLQAINNPQAPYAMGASRKKYTIAVEMTQVIQNYIKMLHACETINEEVKSFVDELASQPERERQRNNSNPFIIEEAVNDSVVVESPEELVVITEGDNDSVVIAESIEPESVITEAVPQQEEPTQIKTEVPEENIPVLEPVLIKIENLEPEREEVIPPKNAKKLQNPEASSAVSKFERCPVRDRREEAAKFFENKKLKKELRWNLAAPSQKKASPRHERNLSKQINDTHLRVGQHCVICHIESPAEFYVRTDQQLFDNFEARFNLDMDKHHQYVFNKYKTKIEAVTQLGDFCGAFIPDSSAWYRVEVLDWIVDDPDIIFIQLIDYGNKVYCSYKNLKVMPDLYYLFSKMAIRCHFAAIYPPNWDITNKWPNTSTDFFIELSEMSEKTQFMTIFVQNDGNSNAVDLRKSSDPDADCLGEILVKYKHAYQEQIPVIESEDELSDEFDNINEAITGYDAQDEARICPFTQKSGRCFKGPACKLEHSLLSEDGVTSDKVLVLKDALVELELPPVGETVDVLVTGYINTCNFYVHILREATNEGPFNDIFQRLLETMKSKEMVQKYENFKLFPGLGELVLVQEGSEWYRGRCVDFINKQEVEVYLVDLGYIVEKSIKDLRQMREDLLYVPFQAVECILNDCQEKKELSMSASRDFFDNVMKMKVFRGTIIEIGEPLRLQLWDSHGMNMSHVLHQWGIGEERKLDVLPAANCILSCQ